MQVKWYFTCMCICWPEESHSPGLQALLFDDQLQIIKTSFITDLFQLSFDLFALCFQKLQLGTNSKFLLQMFFLNGWEFVQIRLSICYLLAQMGVALDNFFELMALVFKIVPQNWHQLSISQVVEIIDKIISDLNVKESPLGCHI